MKENLRKVVIINEMHSQVAFGTGAGGSAQGQKAVIIGDNGRVLFTGDGGNTWEKLPRVTPEHLVSIQFNPFDDFYYEPDGNPTGSPQTNEFSGGMHLPFGNGIATGSVLYNWAKTGEEALTDCLPDGAAPNVDGSAAGRFTATPVQYRCTKPEVATILRTNCGGSLNLGQWRCSAECTGARRDAVVPVVLTDKRASDADWNAWFGTYPEGHQRAGEPYFDRFKGTSAQAKGVRSFVGACDEVWTLGHGRRWHEDTRETRHYQAVPRDEDGIDYMIPLSCDTAARKNEEKREGAWETCALRPAHDVCMYGWPRHLYRMHEGRLLHEDGTVETIPESDWATADQTGYTFLNRPRHDRDSCIAAGGTFYYGANRSLDCVIEFGEITECPSWQVYGMGHSRVADQATRIPFVNFSKISDPCQDEWYGVTCGDYEVLTGEMTAQQVYQTGFTPNQSVTQMWLYSNNLQGRLPTELYALFSLQSLSLGSNRLVGSIPPDLWKNKTHLRYLSLAGNSLTGAIPETLGGLPNVEELKLHHNLLTGEIPEELGQLGKLQSLGLHENSLGGALPSELGKLGSLQYLWLHNNQFNGSLPSEVGQLSELRFLWFANNSVVSLPRHIGRLQRLRSLDGSHNELSVRLPYTLGNMTALRVLKLHHNRMRATTPDSLGLCTELEVLELQNNELVGPVPASFGGLQKLTRLDMSNNLLERKLPVALDGMRKLQYLSLRNNLIEGGVPAAFGALSHLSILDLAGNALTEPLPDELVQCDELEHLDLEGNAITGALPAGIWRLHKLEYLVVDRNALDGPLPEGLGYLKQLRELRLSDNNIDGTLPYTLGDATTLEIVRLDQNKLSGTIPSTIGRLRNVLELNMQVNSLAGAILEIDGMTSALTIKLDRNQLTGQMPVSLGNLTKLEDLELSHNRWRGRSRRRWHALLAAQPVDRRQPDLGLDPRRGGRAARADRAAPLPAEPAQRAAAHLLQARRVPVGRHPAAGQSVLVPAAQVAGDPLGDVPPLPERHDHRRRVAHVLRPRRVHRRPHVPLRPAVGGRQVRQAALPRPLQPDGPAGGRGEGVLRAGARAGDVRAQRDRSDDGDVHERAGHLRRRVPRLPAQRHLAPGRLGGHHDPAGGEAQPDPLRPLPVHQQVVGRRLLDRPAEAADRGAVARPVRRRRPVGRRPRRRARRRRARRRARRRRVWEGEGRFRDV